MKREGQVSASSNVYLGKKSVCSGIRSSARKTKSSARKTTLCPKSRSTQVAKDWYRWYIEYVFQEKCPLVGAFPASECELSYIASFRSYIDRIEDRYITSRFEDYYCNAGKANSSYLCGVNLPCIQGVECKESCPIDQKVLDVYGPSPPKQWWKCNQDLVDEDTRWICARINMEHGMRPFLPQNLIANMQTMVDEWRAWRQIKLRDSWQKKPKSCAVRWSAHQSSASTKEARQCAGYHTVQQCMADKAYKVVPTTPILMHWDPPKNGPIRPPRIARPW